MATTSLAITHALRLVRTHLGAGAFAPFTALDSAAWEAFVCAAELYRRADLARRTYATVALAAALAAAEKTRVVHRAFLIALIVTLDDQPAEEVMSSLWPQLDGLSISELQTTAPEAAAG